ncbi:MAG: hypothetical protein ACETWG_12735, partial [Candidatus Neomarinimicrobiota bacterium]
MRRRLMAGLVFAFSITLMLPTAFLSSRAMPDATDSAFRDQTRSEQTQQRPRQAQPSLTSMAQEIRRINGRLAALKSENDSLRARVIGLERSLRNLTTALPDIRASLESAVRAKAAMDSSELTLVNQLSMIMNKIRLLEDKAAYIDSTNFEILSQLVLIENKIVSLTSSFNDIMAARQAESTPPSAAMTDEEFRSRYIQALTAYQNGQYRESIDKFSGLVTSGSQHELADNSQYWLAECYYAMKNFKRAITEFERVFN